MKKTEKFFGQIFDENGYCEHFNINRCPKAAMVLEDGDEWVSVYDTNKKDEFGDNIYVEYYSRNNLANTTTCSLDEIREVWEESWEERDSRF